MSNKRRRFIWSMLVVAALIGIAAGINQADAYNRIYRGYTQDGNTSFTSVWPTNLTNITFNSINGDNPVCEWQVGDNTTGSWLCMNKTAYYTCSGSTCTSVTGGAADGNNYTVACSFTASGSTITQSCSRNGASNYSSSFTVSAGSGGNFTVVNSTDTTGWWLRMYNSSSAEATGIICNAGYAITAITNNSQCTQFATPSDLSSYYLASNPNNYISSAPNVNVTGFGTTSSTTVQLNLSNGTNYNATITAGTGNASINANTNVLVKANSSGALVNSTIFENSTAAYVLGALNVSQNLTVVNINGDGVNPNIILSTANGADLRYGTTYFRAGSSRLLGFVGNTEIFRVIASGLGVNTTTAARTLDVNGTFRVTNGSMSTLEVTSSATGGSVGIGNTAPNSTVDVTGNMQVRLGNNQVAAFHNNNSASKIEGIGGYIGGFSGLGYFGTTGSAKTMVIATGASLGSPTSLGTERMRVNGTDGKVGINTTVASSTFEVNGNASINGNVATYEGLFSNGSQVCTVANGLCSGPGGSTSPGGSAGEIQYNNGGFGGSPNMSFDNITNAVTFGGDVRLTGLGDRSLIFNVTTGAALYYVASSDRLRLDAGGSGGLMEFLGAGIFFPAGNPYFDLYSDADAQTFRVKNDGSKGANLQVDDNITAGDSLVIGNNATIGNHLSVANYVMPVGQPDYLSVMSTDFFSNNAAGSPPFIGSAVSSGTSTVANSIANHQGILNILDSTTANGGYFWGLSTVTSWAINGSENATLIWKQLNGQDFYIMQRFGFFDTQTHVEPTDGCWFNMQTNNNTGATGNTLKGVCANNGVNANTSTNYTYVNNTWYELSLEINSGSNNVTFRVYNETGSLLWNNSLGGTRVPTLVGRETGFGYMGIQNNTDAAVAFANIDYMDLKVAKRQLRGFGW